MDATNCGNAGPGRQRARLWLAGLAALLWLSAAPAMMRAETQVAAPAASTTGAPITCSTLSNFESPEIKIPDSAPTHMRMMGTRYRDLLEAVAGYQKTHVALIAFNGQALGAAAPVDDPGIYLLAPRLSGWFGGSVAQTADAIYISVLVLSVGLGLAGLYLLLETPLGKWAALVWVLALGACAYHAGDVYLFSMFAAIVIVPWVLYVGRAHARAYWFPIFLLGMGLLMGFCNLMRSYSGTAAALSVASMLLFWFPGNWTRRGVLLLVLTAGVLLPRFWLGTEVHQRNDYLTAACPGYPAFSARHVFWHTVYLGFGFLSNDYVPAFNDSVGYAKVQSIAPGTVYGTARYEEILRHEVVQLVRRHPGFVLVTLAAKAGVLIFVLLAAGNVGLLMAARHPKPWPLELALWIAIAFSALPGLLVVPSSSGYLLGFVSFASLYAVLSIDYRQSMAERELDPITVRRRM